MEPGAPGSGLQFASDVSVDRLALNWQRLILTHLEEREHAGVLTGSPITDMKITVAAGRAHAKHTEGGDFRQATYRAVRNGLMFAENILLEPWYSFALTVPESAAGRAMTDLDRMSAVFSLGGGNGEETGAETGGPGADGFYASGGGNDMYSSGMTVISGKAFGPPSRILPLPQRGRGDRCFRVRPGAGSGEFPGLRVLFPRCGNGDPLVRRPGVYASAGGAGDRRRGPGRRGRRMVERRSGRRRNGRDRGRGGRHEGAPLLRGGRPLPFRGRGGRDPCPGGLREQEEFREQGAVWPAEAL